MRLATKILILFVILAISLELTNARKGGGSRGSSSRGSYSRGSSSRGSSSRVSSYKKSKARKAISTLKKAAVIGVGAYAAYKVAKATKKFAKRVFEGPKFEYNTWNSYRRADGYLCREDIHCNWLDRNFECQTVKDFSWTPITRFNNLKPTGSCGCRAGLVWDDDNLECRADGGLGAGYIVLIVLGIIIALGIGCFIGKKVC